MVQSRYNQMRLNEKELRAILASFSIAKERLEATFQEIAHALKQEKNKHLERLQEAAEAYSRRMDEAVKESKESVWRGEEFTHPNPVADYILKHKPGKDPNFGLHYQIEASRKDFEKLITVKWALPLPDIASYPIDAFTVKVEQDTGEMQTFVVQRKQTLAELRTAFNARKCIRTAYLNELISDR